ncbi:MAG: hypothetical protein A2X31_04495 [Elusimicrobia bacterium GWB2_63_22]|nr:MAG: hypothetical protein A2X31_04495 [Elusimicrobia bacterium GWB2_63_22]
MYFEANKGQTDASVKFFTRAAGYNLYLTASEAVTVLRRAKADKTKAPLVLRMKLKGANPSPSVEGQGILPGRTSYFLGSDKAKWQVGVRQYSRVNFSQVYPGIDMVYRFDKGNVEYDFIVAPGANPGRILMGFKGAKGMRLDPKGNLVLNVEGGELTYQAPKLYQTLGSKRVSVKGHFVLASNNNVRFEVGNYIKSKQLVIDPAIVYGTYLGGSVDDEIMSVAVDATQQAYVTGWANSAMTGAGGFPASTNAVSAPGPDNGARDVFVAKLSADGASIMWLAWLGGALAEQANGIALDNSSASTPNVFITGVTQSAGLGTAFPVAGPALQACDVNTGSLAFVAQLEQPSDIPALVYSTCWGGISGILTNTANGIAVDSLGAAYITGTTFATNFPISAGIAAPYNTMGAASEAAFVVKIAPAGASVVYSMLMGTSDTVTNANAITVDAAGQAWVVGKTTSDTWPANTGAFLGHFSELRTAGVWADGFVAQVAADGTSLLYATYINGATEDEATAVILNNAGAVPYNVFVAGWTVSPTDFPSTAYLLLPTVGPGSRAVPYQQALQGADDAFVLRLNPAEADINRSLEMVYATHVGAAGGAERARSMALDSLDDAYIAGWTRSANWEVAGNDTLVDCSLPCVSRNITGAVQTNTSSDQAAFVAAIDSDGLTRPFFSYLGGSPGTAGKQSANGIIIDSLHNIYVAGITPSNLFPATDGSVMDGSAGTELLNGTGTENATDGFVTKIAPVLVFGAPVAPVVVASCTISGISPASGDSAGGTSVTITGTGFFGVVMSSNVVFGVDNAASYSVNLASTVVTAVSPRHPLVGSLTAGSVFISLVTSSGTCTVPYSYVLAVPACGEDFFYPSPAKGATGTFAYCMALPGIATIKIYNVMGDLVAKLEDSKAAGAQTSVLNTARLAPGVYLYRLEKDYGGSNSTTSKVKKFAVRH